MRRALAVVVLAVACEGPAQKQAAPPPYQAMPSPALARAIHKELVEIDTSPPHGTTRAAEAMAARLRAAGFRAEDVVVVGGNAEKKNLVARLRGTGKRKPLLLVAHLDVVEARREDWATDPFKLVEKDGYLYGRGVLDDKAMASIWLATLLRLKEERFVPDRDVVVALTADEEEGFDNGVSWLLDNRRELIDADLALNEGGGGEIRAGKYIANEVQIAEKLEESYVLEVTNRGGLAAEPRKGENAIYRLAAGLTRLEAFEFPYAIDEVTRAYFYKVATLESGQLADDMREASKKDPDKAALERLAAASPWYASLLRTTCVATLLEAGQSETALPQRAQATVNCRLMPGERLADVEKKLHEVVADDAIRVTAKWHPAESPPSPMPHALLRAVEKITAEMWPGVVVVPTTLPAATDGKYLRAAGIPTYGVSGLFYDIDDEREHGNDERLGVKQYDEGREFLYRLVKALSSE